MKRTLTLGTAAVVNVGPQTAGPRFASADVTGDGRADLVLGLTDYRTFEGDEVPDPVFVLASTADGSLVHATASTFSTCTNNETCRPASAR